MRKAKRIHPRTLNRYLQELTLFHYIQIAGGNKYRAGYQYKITNMNEGNGLNSSIEKELQATIQQIKDEYMLAVSLPNSKTVGQTTMTNPQSPTAKGKASKTTQNIKNG